MHLYDRYDAVRYLEDRKLICDVVYYYALTILFSIPVAAITPKRIAGWTEQIVLLYKLIYTCIVILNF